MAKASSAADSPIEIETEAFKALVVRAAAKLPSRRSKKERKALDLAMLIVKQAK